MFIFSLSKNILDINDFIVFFLRWGKQEAIIIKTLSPVKRV